ncbi:MAG: integrin alpha [Planctomycetota bacterium]|nr:integrin alpha [Planctomycetota bacterium]
MSRASFVAASFALSASAFAQSPLLHRFLGDGPEAQLGFSVAGIGDVDADGHDDVMAGAMSDGTAALPLSGSVRVYSGATGAVLWTAYGEASGDRLGWTVSGLGDVNGDGVPDVIAGAYRNDAHGADSGMIRLYSGLDGAVLRTVRGGDSLDFYGYSVTGVADVDLDGVPDYAVGAWQDETNGVNSGAVYLYSGASGIRIRTFLGAATGERYGYSVRNAGDVDIDGRGDLLIGVPGGRRAEIRAGSDGSIVRTYASTSADDAFGFTVQTAGDLDGDGVPDAMVGAIKFDLNRGYAEIYSGASGALLHHIEGDSQENWFGVGICGLGDLDGDGTAEFSITAFKNDTNGHESGVARVYSGKSGAILHTLIGDSGLDWFGYALANGGDVDADGFDDLVVGTNQDQVNGFHSGSVSIYSGAAFGTATTSCFGDGSGAPCPCANAGAPGIARGCVNSTGLGAALAGSGYASVANDSFSLTVSGLPSTTSVLLFQGAGFTAGGAGAPFGDGLRCVTGSVLRLATRSSAFGVVAWPWFGSTPLSQLGQIPAAGATVHYQAWYRNPAGPCGSAFNLTNAATRTWTP